MAAVEFVKMENVFFGFECGPTQSYLFILNWLPLDNVSAKNETLLQPRGYLA